MAEPFKLTPDEVQTLRSNIPAITAAEETLIRLEKIGVPMDEQKQRLELAKRINAGLLNEFRPTGRVQP